MMEKLKIKLRSFDWRMLLATAASLVIGVLILIKPETSGLLLAYVLAALITIYGIAHTVIYFTSKTPISPFSASSLATGLTILSLGIYLLCTPQAIVSILPVVLGCLLIYLGFVSLQTAIDLLRRKKNLWYIPLIFALVLLICGLVAFVNPFKTAKALMVFLGIALLVEFTMQVAAIILLYQPKTEPVSDAEPVFRVK